MIFIRGLLDRMVLLLAVVAGGCVPSFVNQYHQRVGGRLDQVILDLAPFQQIADRYHGGSMEALVQHHLRSTDPTFHAEGLAIQAMVNSAARLQEVLLALNTDMVHQLAYLAVAYDPDILHATLKVYEPAFVLTMDSLLIAGSVGLLIWLLFLASWKLVALSLSSLFGRTLVTRR